jgi:hypothetical protein
VLLLGAAAAGFVSGSAGELVYAVLRGLHPWLGFLGRVLGWVLLGGLLGWGVSRFIPNLDGTKAALAGLSGGLLGSLAFLLLSELAQLAGRFGGAALLGFCIGLMVAVVEAAFRRAWLEVRYGEREVITVNLGPEPVKVGGDARACTVWARGAPDVALRYFVRDGQVVCTDVPARHEATVANGDARTVGNVTVVVRTSGAPAPARSAPAPLPTPAPLAKPQAASTPVMPTAPAKPQAPPADYDDGLPMPMSPPPPARPAAAPIFELDDAPPKPAATKPLPAPPAPKPPVPAVAKPPAPSAPASAPKAGDPDACPSCGRKVPGRPGARYCMVCDRTY